MKTNQHFLNQSTDGQDVYKFCYRNIATFLDFPAENEHLLSNIFWQSLTVFWLYLELSPTFLL